MTSVALARQSKNAARMSVASASIGCVLFFGNSFIVFTASVFVTFAMFGLALLAVVCWLVLGFVGRHVSSIEEAKLERKAAIESGRCRELLERARGWQFELTEMPLPDPRSFVLGNRLMKYHRFRRAFLLDAAKNPPAVMVALKFLPLGVRMQAPIEHKVSSAKLYESSLRVKTPCVSFPEAQVDPRGRIVNYGSSAVIFGTDLGLPPWQDEISQMDEEPWLWQIPE